MSNRAPMTLDRRERRASQPSTPSSAMQSIANATISIARSGNRSSNTNPATSDTSIRRDMVTRLAAPNRGKG
jgi:hypothetical protein